MCVQTSASIERAAKRGRCSLFCPDIAITPRCWTRSSRRYVTVALFTHRWSYYSKERRHFLSLAPVGRWNDATAAECASRLPIDDRIMKRENFICHRAFYWTGVVIILFFVFFFCFSIRRVSSRGSGANRVDCSLPRFARGAIDSPEVPREAAGNWRWRFGSRRRISKMKLAQKATMAHPTVSSFRETHSIISDYLNAPAIFDAFY